MTQETEIKERLGAAAEATNLMTVQASLDDIPHLLTVIDGLRRDVERFREAAAKVETMRNCSTWAVCEVVKEALDGSLADLPKSGGE